MNLPIESRVRSHSELVQETFDLGMTNEEAGRYIADEQEAMETAAVCGELEAEREALRAELEGES